MNKESGLWGQMLQDIGVATAVVTKPTAALWERTRETRGALLDDLVFKRLRKARISGRRRMR
jgi:hypothetical protein